MGIPRATAAWRGGRNDDPPPNAPRRPHCGARTSERSEAVDRVVSERIVAFSLTGRWAETSDEQTLPITNMMHFDHDTDDPDLCTAFVAGPMADGQWIATFVDGYEQVELD